MEWDGHFVSLCHCAAMTNAAEETSAAGRAVAFPWRVKQRSADEHLARFQDDCEDYVRSAHVGLVHEADTERGTVRVRLHADAEPPMTLGATIGDVLHNLRSALDSVAWAACQRTGVPANRERDVYFPIGTDASAWEQLVDRQLPALSSRHREVFRRLQPWFWEEEARALGVEVRSSGDGHPLVRLHELAKVDRHRVPHPVLARAGHTWLGSDEGVDVRVQVFKPGGARPGELLVEWLLDPPSAAASAHPDGEVVMALSEDGARRQRSALQELQAMQQSVADATRRVEIEVLEVVTSEDLEGLSDLNQAYKQAETTLRSLIESEHVIDLDYVDRYKAAAEAEERARTAALDRWRDLFE